MLARPSGMNFATRALRSVDSSMVAAGEIGEEELARWIGSNVTGSPAD